MEAASKAASRTAQLLTKDTPQEEVSQMMDVMASIKEQLGKVCSSCSVHRSSSFVYLTIMTSSSFTVSSVSILAKPLRKSPPNSLFLHKTEQKHSIAQLHPDIEKVNMLSFHFSSYAKYMHKIMALLQTVKVTAQKISVYFIIFFPGVHCFS